MKFPVNSEVRTQLRDSIEWGKEEILSDLLDKYDCLQVLTEEIEGVENPLIIAARMGRVSILEILYNYDINNFNKLYNNISILETTARCQRYEAAQFLLNKNIHFTEESGSSFMFYASTNGNIDILKLGLQYNMKYKRNTNSQALTCLMAAANNGKIKSLEFLLDQGEDIDERLYASRVGHSGLGFGMFRNPVSTSMDGRTALHFAAYRNQSDAVSFLLSKGANRLIHDESGSTARMLATNQATLEAFGPAIKGESSRCIIS